MEEPTLVEFQERKERKRKNKKKRQNRQKMSQRQETPIQRAQKKKGGNEDGFREIQKAGHGLGVESAECLTIAWDSIFTTPIWNAREATIAVHRPNRRQVAPFFCDEIGMTTRLVDPTSGYLDRCR